jgi:Lipid A 3-O-deacylase (PagL)
VIQISKTKFSRNINFGALIFAGFLAAAPAARCQIGESYEPKNEFGVWAGYSPDSPHVIGTTSERQLGLLAARYGRTLWENHSVAIQYTLDILPLELVLQPKITKIIFTSPPPHTTFVEGHREYVYGGGISPFGLKMNFRRSHRLQPFVASTAGFIASVHRVPIDVPGGTLFNFQFDFQAGLQRYNSSGNRAWMLGYKLTHISNAGRAGLNPGMDGHVIFLGYSFIR